MWWSSSLGHKWKIQPRSISTDKGLCPKVDNNKNFKAVKQDKQFERNNFLGSKIIALFARVVFSDLG